MTQRTATPADAPLAVSVEGARAALVTEVVASLERGRSVLALAAAGMDGPRLVQEAARRLAADRDDVVALRPGVAPFTGWADRVDEIVSLLVREAKERAADDAIWDSLAQAWRVEQGAGDGEAFPTVFRRLVRMLREVSEAAGLILIVIDDIHAWLPADAGDAAERDDLEAGLVALLESHTPPALRLLAVGTPELARPRSSGWPALVAALERVPVEPLDAGEVADVLRREAAGLDEDDIRWVYRMVGGHPRLVRALGVVLAHWRSRRGPLDDATRLSLTELVDDAARTVAEDAIAILRRSDASWLVDRLFEVAVTAEPAGFTPAETLRLWPLGLVDASDRIPERLRAIIARGAVLARGAPRTAAVDDEAAGDETREGSGDADVADEATDDGPLTDMGRKERLLFNYLRERPGTPVHWKELAAAYFVGDPETLQDDEKALRSLRATVNRINAKTSPSEAAARGGWKLIRWSRETRGFYVDREALAQLGH